MSQIDWSKGPEGFPLWLEFKTAEHRVHSGWYRKDGNYFKGYYGAHWPEYRTGQFFNVHYKSEKHLINDAYLAPLSPSPSWNGEGLPPVGIDIEVKHESYGWIGARVVGSDGEAAIVRTNDGYAGVFPHQFRPIRTPATILALLSERAELKRDAERYRYARHLDNDCFMLNTLQRVSGEELDAAIDAAMQSEAKP